MKIIDLLNKIANGEEVPKKIKFYSKYYTWYDNEYTGNEGYCLSPLKADSNSFLEINTVYDLNKEVEIIEEEKKIPEKIDLDEFYGIDYNDAKYIFAKKINEIIEVLNNE